MKITPLRGSEFIFEENSTRQACHTRQVMPGGKGTTVPSEDKWKRGQRFATGARATRHDRAKEKNEARAYRAVQHARAIPVPLRLREGLEKRILCNFWGDYSFLGFVR